MVRHKNLNTSKQWPYFEKDEIEAVQRILSSGKVNYWTGGEVKLFEQDFVQYLSGSSLKAVSYAVALMNGTGALETALYALDIGFGDEVIIPSRTFIATASCVVARGAKPVVVDVDPNSQNLTAETILPAITSKTKAIIVVHLAGWPVEIEPILTLARENNLFVVEDCAQALGAEYKGKKVGLFGDVAAFSFCQDKIMTTGGEGGMLVTKNQDIWQKAWSYKDHGKNYQKLKQINPEAFPFLHDEFGTNLRMTEMQAAIGRVQLSKISKWLKIRQKHAGLLSKVFSNISALRVTIPPRHVRHAFYKYYVFLQPTYLQDNFKRAQLISEIRSRGFSCSTGICGEIYLEKAFEKHQLNINRRLPVSRQLFETSLMFRVDPAITEEDIENMTLLINKFLSKNLKNK